jgi:hypothetical protein
MIADDVRALPAAPSILAEGTTVSPAVAGTGRRAVWLVASPEVQRERLAERGLSPGVTAWYLHLGRVIAAQAAEAGADVLVVDGFATAEDTVAAVSERFADALAEASVAETPAARRALARYANRAVVDQYRGYYARPWAIDTADTTVRAFWCECGRAECTEDVEVTIAGFPETTLLAPGHG